MRLRFPEGFAKAIGRYWAIHFDQAAFTFGRFSDHQTMSRT
jgi:hypothetical protein